MDIDHLIVNIIVGLFVIFVLLSGLASLVHLVSVIAAPVFIVMGWLGVGDSKDRNGWKLRKGQIITQQINRPLLQVTPGMLIVKYRGTYRVGVATSYDTVVWRGEVTFNSDGNILKFDWYSVNERDCKPTRVIEVAEYKHWNLMADHQDTRPATNLDPLAH